MADEGKKPKGRKKHSSVNIWEKYEVSGETAKPKNKFCPRCGSGTFLSEQKNREYCGKCGYTNFKGGSGGKESPPEKEGAPEGEKKPAEGEQKPAEGTDQESSSKESPGAEEKERSPCQGAE